MKHLFAVLFILLSITSFAQKGTVQGTIYDKSTGKIMEGVTVLVKSAETTAGNISDMDGAFSIDVASGTYALHISFMSYETLVINGVVVKPGEVTLLNDIQLNPSAEVMDEVVKKAVISRESDLAITVMKMKSPSMVDGISANKMQLTGDGNAAEAARRVTGVSVEGGKYVYIRGLGDRYSKTTLNRLDIPGLDPDFNSLQMDMFPSGMIDNIIVSKNFMAENPADFTGGIMNIETKGFPESKILSFSFSTSYNPNMHFNPNYLTYQGGKTDFLGFDDGTRALPQGAGSSNIPTPINSNSEQGVNEFVSSFNPELGASRQTSFMDMSGSFTIGNQKDLNGFRKINGSIPKLGYIFSASYKSEFRYYNDVVYGEYQKYIDPDKTEMRYATIQNGELGERNILAGLLGGLAFQTDKSKFRLMAMHLQNGQSRAGKFNIRNDGEAVGQSGYFAVSDNLEYNERSMTNLLLNGTHLISNSKWEVDWRLSPTISRSSDPDIRKTAFTYTDVDTFFSAGAGGNPTRIWRSLSEFNSSGRLDFVNNYKFKNREAKMKFGVSHNYKKRDYEILFFDIQFFGGQSWSSHDPNQVLDPENLYPNKPNSIYYQSGNNTPNPNEYSSNSNNLGVYYSNEFSVSAKLKSIIGLRSEYFVLRHTGRDQYYASGDKENGTNLENEKVLESVNLFPSLNLIYEVTSKQNLRFSYSKTVARPSFKEMSFAQILDPITNRIFNGGMFTYNNWDGNLVETKIDNLDFRWDLFLKSGQIFSVSAFYKKFKNPIELVRIPEQQTSTEYQPRNVGDGTLYGLEFEFMKDLGFVSPKLGDFNIGANVTVIYSAIDMSETEYNSRKSYEKSGENIKNTRAMAGQAPYVINSGLTYSKDKLGLDAGLYYNVKGPTLYIVGAGLFPDIYVMPFHSLNFSINKKIGKEKKTVIDFKASNLLNNKVRSYYQAYNADPQPFSSMNPGRSFSIGLGYKF